MDSYSRQVYLSVGGLLFILWMGMLVWAIQAIKPEIFAFLSAPLPASSTITLLSKIPDIRFSVYRVINGDTFFSVAQKFHLQEETLRSLNQANDATEPKAEALLTVPSKNGIFHTVRSGQGLADIARAYGIPLKEILKSNHKRGDADIHPGEILYLSSAPYLSNQDIRWIALSSLETRKGFLKPTTGRFADGFGKRIHPITGKLVFHEGLDLAPGWGARVVASQAGAVVFTGIRRGYGRLIILDHGNGLTSWYAHLDEVLVKLENKVKRGELIGKVGNTGRVTGPHLHFEVRLNGVPQNPLLYLVQ